MNTQTQRKTGRVKKSNVPIYMRFSELLVLLDKQKVIRADGQHYMIVGDTLRPIEVAWGRDH